MDREQQLDEVITAYLKAVEAGEPIDQAEWLKRYPHLADDLAEFFAGQRSVERVAAPLRDQIHSSGADALTLPPSTQAGIDPKPRDERSDSRGPRPGDKVRYFGDYELLEEIARGGMGIVYKARQVSLNRNVALKMILAGQLAGDADVKRFHREAEAAANLDHPNIVPIYEVGEHEGQHYFSMKLIDGVSLARRAAGMTGDPKSAAKLVAKIARAVHDAHQHGILHRDLKPSNILIDAKGEPHVADFGLARRIDGRSPETRTGAIVGTPSYLSPEQARSEKSLTTAVDVYGLGAVLYELLTGRPPFRAESELETILQVLDRDPPRPRTVNPRIDRDLETICLKCLEKEPPNRYSSALALAEDLERWSAGHTIQARPSGPARRLWKWVRRNPTLTVLLVVLPLWYFNVRLPWQWAWLDWALLGVLMLLGLSRLVVLCRRAIARLAGASLEMDTGTMRGPRRWAMRLIMMCGRPLGWSTDLPPEGIATDTALDLARDAFWVPATVLALLVLCFYPGDLADRKSLAYTIVFTAFSWGFVVQWLWRRRQAGPLSLAVRADLAVAVILGAFFSMLLIQDTVALLHISEQAGDLLVNLCARISSMSGAVFLFLAMVVGIEIRKHGAVTFFSFVRWQEIESFDWGQSWSKELLSLRLKLRDNPLPLQRLVHRAKKEQVHRALQEHVPHIGQDVSTSDDAAPVVVAHEREPAERVRDAAFLLIASGLMQVGGSLIFLGLALRFSVNLERDLGISTIVALPLLFLVVASILVGVIVLAGAVKMRQLKNYRFCRMSAIVAMLPLGAGFLLGLPFGIWALLVLRRPDVQAAFAGGANHGPRAEAR